MPIKLSCQERENVGILERIVCAEKQNPCKWDSAAIDQYPWSGLSGKKLPNSYRSLVVRKQRVVDVGIFFCSCHNY